MIPVQDTYIMNNIPYDILLAVLRHDADAQWQDVGRSGIVAIIYTVRIEYMSGSRRCTPTDGKELLVKGLCHLLADRTPDVGLAAPLFQQLHHTDDIRRRDECSVGLTGRVLRVD